MSLSTLVFVLLWFLFQAPCVLAQAAAQAALCSAPLGSCSLDVRYTNTAGVAARYQSYDVYFPPEYDKLSKIPPRIVMYVHGGGWRKGDKWWRNIVDKVNLFRNSGLVFVSTNYRLSDQPGALYQHPCHTEDVAAAVAHVLDSLKAAELTLLGHSAGAHVVALVGTNPKYLGAHNRSLRSLSWVGSFDTEGYDIPQRVVNMGGISKDDLIKEAFGSDPAVWAAASPINNVNGSPLQPPPFLMAKRGDAGRQAIVDAFAAKLQGVDVEVTVIAAKNLDHQGVQAAIGQPGDKIMTPPIVAAMALYARANVTAPNAASPSSRLSAYSAPHFMVLQVAVLAITYSLY